MAVSKEEILTAIGNMSLIDVTDLVKMMEDKFGVSAAAPVAAAAVGGGAAAAAPAEEKTEFTVALKATGEKKVILFNLSGHGHFDLAAYEKYLDGSLEDYEYVPDEAALASLPKVG